MYIAKIILYNLKIKKYIEKLQLGKSCFLQVR